MWGRLMRLKYPTHYLAVDARVLSREAYELADEVRKWAKTPGYCFLPPGTRLESWAGMAWMFESRIVLAERLPASRLLDELSRAARLRHSSMLATCLLGAGARLGLVDDCVKLGVAERRALERYGLWGDSGPTWELVAAVMTGMLVNRPRKAEEAVKTLFEAGKAAEVVDDDVDVVPREELEAFCQLPWVLAREAPRVDLCSAYATRKVVDEVVASGMSAVDAIVAAREACQRLCGCEPTSVEMVVDAIRGLRPGKERKTAAEPGSYSSP
jgi:hypothetical protein